MGSCSMLLLVQTFEYVQMTTACGTSLKVARMLQCYVHIQ